MRRSYSAQYRFDCDPVTSIELNLACRDEIIPILAALQHIYGHAKIRAKILRLIGRDVNSDSSPEHGRQGMEYWQILVLAAVRLGCNFDYDRLQDLAENHRTLRHMMGLGDWDEQTVFNWRTIRNTLCLLRTETIAKIYQLIVAEGHKLEPDAAKRSRADSFVVETNIHYPTESGLIFDGVRKIIELGVPLALALGITGWRQHSHLLKTLKHLHRKISRISASKNPQSKERQKKLYQRLLKRATGLLERAETLVDKAKTESVDLLVRIADVRTFIGRTRQVASTAYRRVILGETVPNEDKLFSIFEPHTQLYRRGKAATPNQFGRLVLIYEDGAGFVTHHYLLPRDAQDADVIVRQTRIVQNRLGGRIKEISLDRGFYTVENEKELRNIVRHPCLPKRGAKQFAAQEQKASIRFRNARRRHAGIESAIGALQAGNGMERCRDRTEVGFARYLALAILGRNLQTLGKLLIQQQAPDSFAAISKRKHAA